MGQINDRLQRIRELAVQGLNGTLSIVDHDAVQTEINLNLDEIDRLTTQTNYNGIPLLNGRAGTVSLQVGANDNETLGIDLNPPGFSVEELGLKDLTVFGLEGEVTPRQTLPGTARDIVLDDPATTVSFPTVTESNPTLVRNNSGQYFIRAQDAQGDDILYRTAIDADHYTNTDTSTVRVVKSGTVYSGTTTINSSSGAASIAFRDSDGNSLANSQRTLMVDDSNQYYIATTNNGETLYQEADITFQAGTNALEARAVNDKQTTVAQPIFTNAIDGYDLSSSNTTATYLDADGNNITGASLFEDSDGKHYIQSTDGDGKNAYYRAEISNVDTSGGNNQLDIQAIDDIARYPSTIAGIDTVDKTPEMSYPADESNVAFFDGQGTSIAANNARLLSINNGNDFLLEVKNGGGMTEYYAASVTANSTNGNDSFVVKAINSTGQSFEEVDKVAGTSLVTLDPRNVTLNYTDAKGNTFSDVLRQGDNGQYIVDLPDAGNAYGAYKTATLVNDDKGNTLIKTVNGNGEVIVYYPADVTNVRSDADGFDDSGTAHTIINLREVDQELRLKQPNDPLAALDRAIARVDDKRSLLGATENRLGSVVDTLTTTSTNLSAARSRIMDADYATEVANMTRAQILQQAGTSVLAQANQLPQSVLSLLG